MVSASTVPVSLRNRLVQMPTAARHRLLTEYIVGQIRETLGLEPEDDTIHPRSRFEELGVDSKRAVEFKELLEEELHCALSTTVLFDHPNPESLAGYVLGQAFGQPSCAEGRRPEDAVPANSAEPGSAEEFEERLRRKLEQYEV